MITDTVHGANLVDVVYGQVPSVGDAAEDFVEATKLHRDAMSWDAPGVRMLETTPEMHGIIARAGQRHVSRVGVELPAVHDLAVPLTDVMARRRSASAFRDAPITLEQLSTLLRTVWEPREGTGPQAGTQPRRATPSAGALFPLELWVVVRRVDELEPGLYHVEMPDAGVARLAFLGSVDHAVLARAGLQEAMVENAACTIVMTMMPWRSRFKYGMRAVRFALMEAGHACQSFLLVATALGLASRPLGGFCDDEVSAALGLCGVDEVPLYLVPVGRGD